MKQTRFSLALLLCFVVFSLGCQTQPPLASWNEGSTKSEITAFVEQVTDKNNSAYVAPEDRIAVFDNDGTLWSEMPLYFQVFYVFDRIRELAPQHPEWQTEEPFASVLKGDIKGALAGGEHALVAMTLATHTGLDTDAFSQSVQHWIQTAKHPVTGQPYTHFVYQPMLELLDYLRANDFTVYIVSGGGVDFMRAWTESVYQIPPQQVIGSRMLTEMEMHNGTPVLMRKPKLEWLNDKENKAVAIHHIIGKRPIMAFGNSDGDLPMLQWVAAGEGARFAAYVHHTDDARETAYDRKSSIGRLDRGLDAAEANGWTRIDMKRDWKQVFPSTEAR